MNCRVNKFYKMLFYLLELMESRSLSAALRLATPTLRARFATLALERTVFNSSEPSPFWQNLGVSAAAQSPERSGRGGSKPRNPRAPSGVRLSGLSWRLFRVVTFA